MLRKVARHSRVYATLHMKQLFWVSRGGGLVMVSLLISVTGCALLSGVDDVDHHVEPFCEAGTTESCYTGPAGTESRSGCKEGLAPCLPDGSAFGPCEGDIKPKTCVNPDTCACECEEGRIRGCYAGEAPGGSGPLGVCEEGTQTCVDGLWSTECLGEKLPAVPEETCRLAFNAKDDDCDGQEDETAGDCECDPNTPVLNCDGEGGGPPVTCFQACDENGKLGPCNISCE